MIVAYEFSSFHYHLLQIPMNLNQYKYGSANCKLLNYIETVRKPEYCVFTIRGLDYYIIRCLEEWF